MADLTSRTSLLANRSIIQVDTCSESEQANPNCRNSIPLSLNDSIYSKRQSSSATRVLIVGAGESGEALARQIDAVGDSKFKIVGFVDPDHHLNPRMLGKTRELSRILRSCPVDVIVVTMNDRNTLRRTVRHGVRSGSDVYFVPGEQGTQSRTGGQAPPCVTACFPIIRETHGIASRFLKRMIDVVGSILGMIIVLPILPILALAIKLDSQGTVFYCSKRVGKGGQFIPCFKLRTMVREADAMRKELHHLNERAGLLFKISDDPRTTRLGRFLRKYSFDELPQLWNVFLGHMSLVGPRPPLVSEYRHYDSQHLERLAVKPGITGLWQVTARNNPSFESYLVLDLHYVRSWSVWLDLKILLNTIPAVFKGTGQ